MEEGKKEATQPQGPTKKAQFLFRVMNFCENDLKMTKPQAQKVAMTYIKVLNEKIMACNLEDLDDIVRDYELN
ncbi:unnamed protein product [Moneuplotes crassus]|uniref:Uncharacterized protein n=1 Tax=Euplotes crassus TaxID=5936 RepID=A0AAD1XYF0_EUPCR|nr:unnamed protein product [Moneuplotes crassus]